MSGREHQWSTNGSLAGSVYNLKRRVASLPPISAEAYGENVTTSLVSSKQEPLDQSPSSSVENISAKGDPEERGDEVEASISERSRINCCLFCTMESKTLETCLEHMLSEHGLYIPEIEHVSNLEAIVGYLRTLITDYNECLHCGITKQSAQGTRQHMLDKGHCMINLEREPELLEFWEFSDSDNESEEAPKAQAQNINTEASKYLLEGEYTLPTGKVIGSKSKAREARLFARRTTLAGKETSSQMITEGATESVDESVPADVAESLPNTRGGTQDRTVAVRDAAGLIGISDNQIRSLNTVQRKMQRQQALVRASAAWAGDRGGTHQRHYKQKMNLRAG